MHYHLEIIMPETQEIAQQVASIMNPISEHEHERGEESSEQYAFWDYYEISGRYSGQKIIQQINPEDLASFWKMIQDTKITVSGVTCGKQTLRPKEQEKIVDALWAERFPDSGISSCPLFDHSDAINLKENKLGAGNVMRLKDVPQRLKADRVIIAGPEGAEKFEALSMYQMDFFNGVCWQNSDFDGLIATAIARHKEHFKNAVEEYRIAREPKDDWLVVTVDYHN